MGLAQDVIEADQRLEALANQPTTALASQEEVQSQAMRHNSKVQSSGDGTVLACNALAQPDGPLRTCPATSPEAEQGPSAADPAGAPLQWTRVVEAEEWQCAVRHKRSPFSAAEIREMYETVHRGTEWRQMAGMQYRKAWMAQPLCTCSCKCGRFLVGVIPFPKWMTELMGRVMPLVGLPRSENWPNSCNLNFYLNGGSHVGWHSDDESLFQGVQRRICIISLSLGGDRGFQVQGSWPGAVKSSVTLRAGDLLTMEGNVQRYYKHRVPRDGRTKVESKEHVCPVTARQVPQSPVSTSLGDG